MVKVILVSDQAIFVEGLRFMLETSGRATLACSVQTVQQLAELAGDMDSAVVVIDLENPLDLSLLKSLRERRQWAVCLLTRKISTELFFQAREAGLSGIISTTRPANELVAILLDIFEGQLFFDQLLSESHVIARCIHLTPREGHLVELLTRGLKNKEIAYQLGITEGTVKVYLSKLFQKVGAKDRFDLALSGLKNLGLTTNNAESAAEQQTPAKADTLRTLVTRMTPVRDRRADARVLAG